MSSEFRFSSQFWAQTSILRSPKLFSFFSTKLFHGWGYRGRFCSWTHSTTTTVTTPIWRVWPVLIDWEVSFWRFFNNERRDIWLKFGDLFATKLEILICTTRIFQIFARHIKINIKVNPNTTRGKKNQVGLLTYGWKSYCWLILWWFLKTTRTRSATNLQSP